MTARALGPAAGLAVLFAIAVGPARAASQTAAAGPEAMSLLGRPLMRTPAAGEDLVKLEKALADAARAHAGAPDDLDALVAHGRALAGLWRYRDAIDVYTRGLAAHPDAAVLYRHRGHRFISLRRFDDAAADLERAASLKTDDFDIWYHLGLVRYLRGEFAAAEAAYRKCREVSKDDGSIIAVSNWLYLTLRRQGRTAEAARVLEGIREGMDAGENGSYYGLLLFYKGIKPQADLEAAAGASGLDLATTGYGLACWHLSGGDADKAFALFDRILAIPYWPAFGYIAAEAEVHRARRGAGR